MKWKFTRKPKVRLSKVYFVDARGNLIVKEKFSLSEWLSRRSSWELYGYLSVVSLQVLLVGFLMSWSYHWFYKVNTLLGWGIFAGLLVIELVVLALLIGATTLLLNAYGRYHLAPKVRRFIERFEDNISPPDKSN